MADAKNPILDPKKELEFLFLVFGTLWIIWFINGGPARYEASLQKPFLRPPTSPSYDEQAGRVSDPRLGDQYGSLPSINIKAEVKIIPTPPPQAKPPQQPIFIRPIISISKGLAGPSGLSYLRVDFSSANKNPISMTGLWVRDLFNGNLLIKNASPLPYQGRVNEEKSVLVPPGSVIYLIEGESPIGVSFRVNKCISMLGKFQEFYPTLRRASPDFALTYNDCVDAHKDDPDFYDNDWRLYFENSNRFWLESGDIVRLMDSFGNVLASRLY